MSVKTNIADYLSQIETLTNTNLQILKTINDSFFTKKNHLFAEIDDSTYVIPSFISLENKVNMLQENFENLVKAPETGEAFFNFDGNTRAIEVRKYSHVPDSITLSKVNSYQIENNDIFKDFLTPVPYINLTLPYTLPNDIVEVNVKKIIAKSDDLKALFKNKLSYVAGKDVINNKDIIKYHQSHPTAYSDIYKQLLNYTEDVDYVEYDTIYKLPIRNNIGSGTYIIEQVVSDVINDDLEELITLKINGSLTYKLFNEVIEKPLQIGDELINYDGTGKVKITEIRTNTNTIVVKVVNGEYLNFVGTDTYDTNDNTDIHELSKLRFYSPIDFDDDKFIKVPLEEDQYVFVAVAALNSRMNVQSSWGTGLLIDTYSLTNNDVPFKNYYDTNVKNIGDILFEISNMITAPITALTNDTFDALSKIKPVVKSNALSVMHINKHLNNSTTAKNIKNAYSQKKTAEGSLSEIQSKINEINEKLAAISFNDTTGIRSAYTAQLSQYNQQKNELLTVINSAIDTISLNVNNAEIPLENAKYRIRGFFVPDFADINNINVNSHVIGIQVQYRYKNLSSETGNAVSMTGIMDQANTAYIYSDWNVLTTKNKDKIALYNSTTGTYTYAYEESNEVKNEPSYNQIDIPISQGETVDIRLKVIYDFGQPYVTMTSNWSDIISISFPEEFTKDIPILSIIEENNNDIETNRFNSILETSGINNHINDMFMDQNITYFHKPDNIASGFYTDERKVIPLKDKLVSMINDIAMLKTEILGSEGTFKVSATIGNNSTEIYSDRDNTIVLEAFNNFNKNEFSNGAYNFNSVSKIASTLINISIANTSDSVIKLYPIFPGNRDIIINNSKSIYADKDNYSITTNTTNEGVYYTYLNADDNKAFLQTHNQFITFRVNDPWTRMPYYSSNADAKTLNGQSSSSLPRVDASLPYGMAIYPFLSTKYGMCTDSNNNYSYTSINPGEEVVIPLYCEYKLSQNVLTINKTISFDIRTSLHKEPINYTFKVVAKHDTSAQDILLLDTKKQILENITPIKLKYNSIIK